MPEANTVRRAAKQRRRGRSPSTQAGEFIREEVHHVREGRHGARSTKQAIAIGLSKARRAGVELPAPEKGSVPPETRGQALRDSAKGRRKSRQPSKRRSRAVLRALRRESGRAASRKALALQARRAAKRRTPAERSASARKAARTRARRGRGSVST